MCGMTKLTVTIYNLPKKLTHSPTRNRPICLFIGNKTKNIANDCIVTFLLHTFLAKCYYIRLLQTILESKILWVEALR